MEESKEKSSAQAMSEFCIVAHKMYELWEKGGSGRLAEFLENELEIPEDKARFFANNYHPSSPPVDVCPVEAIKNSWSSSVIFSELAVQLSSDAVWPKNVLAWWIMKHIFGGDVFNFCIPEEASSQQKKNTIHFPALPSDENGNAVQFGLAALEMEGVRGVPVHVIRKAKRLYAILGDIGYELAKTLIDADFIFPPNKEISQLAAVIKEGLDGKKIVITGAFCPDYAYEETGDPQVPYQYTFEGVSGGIGLVAQQFVRVLPHLVKFLKKYGIEFEIALFIADFEANSEDILRKVRKDKEEFVSLCRESLKAFSDSLPDIDMHLFLFERECGNGRLEEYMSEAHEEMKRGNFGEIQGNTGKNPLVNVVNFIAKANRTFYEKWHGRKMSDSEIENLVVSQGAEYAAMGRIFQEDFGEHPFIQVAGDRPKMQVFNSMYSNHPTLCTKRVY